MAAEKRPLCSFFSRLNVASNRCWWHLERKQSRAARPSGAPFGQARSNGTESWPVEVRRVGGELALDEEKTILGNTLELPVELRPSRVQSRALRAERSPFGRPSSVKISKLVAARPPDGPEKEDEHQARRGDKGNWAEWPNVSLETVISAACRHADRSAASSALVCQLAPKSVCVWLCLHWRATSATLHYAQSALCTVCTIHSL